MSASVSLCVHVRRYHHQTTATLNVGRRDADHGDSTERQRLVAQRTALLATNVYVCTTHCGFAATLALSHNGVWLSVRSYVMMDQIPTFGPAYPTIGCCYRAVGVNVSRDQCLFIRVLINAHFVSTAQRTQMVAIRRTPQQSQYPLQCLVYNRCTNVGTRR